MTLEVQNLKCGGCGTTITKKLEKLPFLKNLQVNIAESTIQFEGLSRENLQVVREKLSEMGYPIVGDSNTLVKKAKSYVSCAQGKFH